MEQYHVHKPLLLAVLLAYGAIPELKYLRVAPYCVILAQILALQLMTVQISGGGDPDGVGADAALSEMMPYILLVLVAVAGIVFYMVKSSSGGGDAGPVASAEPAATAEPVASAEPAATAEIDGGDDE